MAIIYALFFVFFAQIFHKIRVQLIVLGSRVKKSYQLLAKQAGITWKGRNYDRNQWDSADIPNRCISSATACLYGISEAAILAAGYAPAIGFSVPHSRVDEPTANLSLPRILF